MSVRRACFTCNNPSFATCETLWNLGHSDAIQYLIYGAEHTDNPQQTPHFQGFVIFKTPRKPSTICNLLGGHCYVAFPKQGDPSARCANYCKKEGFYLEFGTLPGQGGRPAGDDLSASELRQQAITWLQDDANKYCRFKDIPATLLMTQGFLNAWTARRKVQLGPDRPDLKIITIVGPTACGKSFASHNIFPDHAKCFYGNSGAWFSNGDAPVLLIEEFSGQIPLQKMLTILDHYPFQLEEKGGFAPALYTTVVITSNITPDHWYSNSIKQGKMAEEAMRLGIPLDEAEKRWNEAKKALYDRIGYKTNKRGCGFYNEWAHSGLGNEADECVSMRSQIWDWLSSIAGFGGCAPITPAMGAAPPLPCCGGCTPTTPAVGASPPDPLLGASPPDPSWGLRPHSPCCSEAAGDAPAALLQEHPSRTTLRLYQDDDDDDQQPPQQLRRLNTPTEM
ncbi:replication-associated protein [Capybara virus 29_cap3_1096]|nr:replication-associated protein [Capybara virus 29_cap3_1096]